MARKKKHDDHDNHERWLVSYADFITLLFAFFVVMYAISSVNEGKYRVLSDSLAAAFRNIVRSAEVVQIGPRPAGRIIDTPAATPPSVRLPGIKQQREQMSHLAQDILKVLEPLVKEKQVRVTQNRFGVAVEINASVLFAPGQAALAPGSEKALRAVAQVLKHDRHAIRVEGHTDDIPINTPSFPSNWELSTARAATVVRLFQEEGVAGERLAAVGYSAYRPVASNSTPEGRARNRRVMIMILADAPQVPDSAHPDFSSSTEKLEATAGKEGLAPASSLPHQE